MAMMQEIKIMRVAEEAKGNKKKIVVESQVVPPTQAINIVEENSDKERWGNCYPENGGNY